MLAVQQGHICICQACRTQPHANSVEYVGQLRYVLSIKPYGRTFQAVPTKGENNVGIVRDGPICATVVISSILA